MTKSSMDWNALKDKAVAFGNKASEKAFTALESASGHLYEGLKKGPFSIKNGSEFDEFKALPLAVVLVLGKEDAASKSILARVPALYKDAWVYSANLKVILAEEVPDLVGALDIHENPAVIVYRKGVVEKRFEGAKTLDFVRSFDLAKPKEEAAPVPEGMVDVLSGATPVAAVSAVALAPTVTVTGQSASTETVSAPAESAPEAPAAVPVTEAAPAATMAAQVIAPEVPSPAMDAVVPDAAPVAASESAPASAPTT